MCISKDITASLTPKILGINKNIINSYYNIFRKLLF